jgi:tRNA(adenine34) deaminase
MTDISHEFFMHRALELAQQAQAQGEVPIGAVLVFEQNIIGEGYNQPITLNDPTAHAEILALRAAGQQLHNYRLLNTTLFITLEPCAMCAAAIVHARVKTVIYAATDPKSGAVCSHLKFFEQSFLNHKVQVEQGPLQTQASALLTCFFKSKRTAVPAQDSGNSFIN